MQQCQSSEHAHEQAPMQGMLCCESCAATCTPLHRRHSLEAPSSSSPDVQPVHTTAGTRTSNTHSHTRPQAHAFIQAQPSRHPVPKSTGGADASTAEGVQRSLAVPLPSRDPHHRAVMIDDCSRPVSDASYGIVHDASYGMADRGPGPCNPRCVERLCPC